MHAANSLTKHTLSLKKMHAAHSFSLSRGRKKTSYRGPHTKRAGASTVHGAFCAGALKIQSLSKKYISKYPKIPKIKYGCTSCHSMFTH
jgi:hypothetical protein